MIAPAFRYAGFEVVAIVVATTGFGTDDHVGHLWMWITLRRKPGNGAMRHNNRAYTAPHPPAGPEERPFFLFPLLFISVVPLCTVCG